MISYDVIGLMSYYVTLCHMMFLQCTKVKFHMILHYPASIRLFGVVRNFVAESFEMAHKPSKAAAKRTNWQVSFMSYDIT
jgi:hypothetical protein